ncbi:MAG: hypothetical protein AB7Q97_01655 [Gammaproteobacteria bacterium]
MATPGIRAILGEQPVIPKPPAAALDPVKDSLIDKQVAKNVAARDTVRAARAVRPLAPTAAPAVPGATPGAAPAAVSRVGASVAAAGQKVPGAIKSVVKGATRFGLPLLAGAAGYEGIKAAGGQGTPTEQYARDLGIDESQVGRSVAGDMGIRALGVGADLANTALLGLPRMLLSREQPFDPNAQATAEQVAAVRRGAPGLPQAAPVVPQTPEAVTGAAAPGDVAGAIRNNRTGAVRPLIAAPQGATEAPDDGGVGTELARLVGAQTAQRILASGPTSAGEDSALAQARTAAGSGGFDPATASVGQVFERRLGQSDRARGNALLAGQQDLATRGITNASERLKLRSLQDLRSIYNEIQSLDDTNDPGGARRRELVRTALILGGKDPKGRFEFKTVQGVDPVTGLATQSLMKLDPESGAAEPVSGAGGAAAPPTPADLESTAQKYGLTVDQVKQQLGIQ